MEQTVKNTVKNRGYFSEKAIKASRSYENPPDDQKHANTALICLMHAWSIQTERFSPILDYLPVVHRANHLEPSAQKWIRYPGNVSIEFPVQTIKPKVQLAHDTTPGHLPREVGVNRQRKIYEKINIKDLLIEAGIDIFRLIPVNVIDRLESWIDKRTNIFHKSCLFPLEWFDNCDYDQMTPHEWLQLGYINGVMHPIPGEAFLPDPSIQDNPHKKNILTSFVTTRDSAISSTPQDRNGLKKQLYTWTKVAVKNYDDQDEKWIVMDLDTGFSYKIPRIYLMFTAENPHDFIKRLQFALNFREKCERTLKFEVIVDCFQLTEIPRLDPNLLERMFKLAKNTVILPNVEWLDDLQLQVNLCYQRVQALLDFKTNVLKHPEKYTFVDIPENYCSKRYAPIVTIGMERFRQLKQQLKRSTIFYLQKSIDAMYAVASECETIDKQSLFVLSTAKSSSLKDFATTQQYTSNTVAKYLKGFWLENMIGQICMHLRGVGKGWLDITINDWGIYLISKIFKFLRQVKFRMQDALHRFLERAIIGYSKFICDPCELIQDIADDTFRWDYSFNHSPFHPKAPHVFILSMSMDDNGARFSTDPDTFLPMLVNVLDEALLQCCGIHQVDPNVMSALIFRNDLYLKSMVLVEDLIEKHRKKIVKIYDRAVIPLKAYGQKFDEFIPLHLLSVTNYVYEFFNTNKTPYEVKEEILIQMRMRDRLEEDLPKSIVIGPFMVNVEPLKQILITKRKEIIKQHLEAYTQQIFRKTETLIDQFQQVMTKISEKAGSIEHVFTIREYAESVPETVAPLTEILRLLILEYDILDYFWHSLSDEQFALKWEAIGWPYKIMQYLDGLKEIQELEVDEFKRMQISDVILFDDQLDSLSDEILKWSLMHDPAKAVENAAKIKKTWKLVTDLEKQGEILAMRQSLFEMPSMDLSALQELVLNIERYKSLWYSCADFLKNEEIAYGNNLVNLDVPELKATIASLRENLTQALDDFNDRPEIYDVAQHYLDLIDKFQPSLTIIECVRSPHWTIVHWQELAKRGAIDMKFSLSINFKYCMSKGILDHLELVQDIWERSKNEADLEAKLVAEIKMRQQEEAKALIEKKKNRKGRKFIW